MKRNSKTLRLKHKARKKFLQSQDRKVYVNEGKKENGIWRYNCEWSESELQRQRLTRIAEVESDYADLYEEGYLSPLKSYLRNTNGTDPVI